MGTMCPYFNPRNFPEILGRPTLPSAVTAPRSSDFTGGVKAIPKGAQPVSLQPDVNITSCIKNAAASTNYQKLREGCGKGASQPPYL